MSNISQSHPDRAQYLRALQRYVANVGISGSSLRNQGAAKVVKYARQFLADLDLAPLNNLQPSGYASWLDKITDKLRERLPENAQRWGAARKAINIFMAHAALNRELAGEFGLTRFDDVMETPLDSVAASELRRIEGGDKLPRWPGVGRLTPEVSRHYQEFASTLAKRRQIPRAYLDVILWRPVDPTT